MQFRLRLRIEKDFPKGAAGRIVQFRVIKSRRLPRIEIRIQDSMFRTSNELKILGQGTHARRQPSHGKPWWVCFIAALSFCLWSANVLPIQKVEYQLTTNLAISQHRMPLLQRLAGKSTESASKNLALFSALEIQSDESSPSASANSDLRSVRVKIRCPIHCDIHDVERSLNELTAPALESSECLDFAKQLQKEQWLLESSAHSMKRLELDLERERNAIATDTVDTDTVDTNSIGTNSIGTNSIGTNSIDTGLAANQDSEEFRTSTPFRLASFSAPRQAQSELMEKLRRLNQTRSENVDSMLLTLERLKAKARGFLSLTGAPRIDPVVRPLTVFRFLVLCVLCATVWLLLMGWLNPILGRRLSGQESPQFNRAVLLPHETLTASESSNSGIKKAIRWMQREGIPYLGAIQVVTETSVVNDATHELRTQQRLSSMPTEVPASKLDSNQLLKSLGEGSLVLWIGLFAARLMFDPLWRELIAVAPLAAISRMISGIQ